MAGDGAGDPPLGGLLKSGSGRQRESQCPGAALLETPGPSVREFLTSWYGPADRAASPFPPSSVHVPQPLADWFDTVSCWSKPVTVQNHVVPLNDLQDEDGKVVFCGRRPG